MTRTAKAPFRFRLDPESGVPVYRQIIDQVQGGLASGALASGDQLPTVRQVAVDLAINPNTVLRAYRELEIRGVLDTQQGTGTFISDRKIMQDEPERGRAAGATGERIRGARRSRRIHGAGVDGAVERVRRQEEMSTCSIQWSVLDSDRSAARAWLVFVACVAAGALGTLFLQSPVPC